VVTLLVIVGSLPAIAVANVSLFSVALFPLLLGLLERESDVPTDRVWLVVPLLAAWGNLHGAVLVGWALLVCYLVFRRGRQRPLGSVALLVTATLALFANPALWHTLRYYRGVFENEAARQRVGLWTPLGTSAFHLLAVAVFAVLLLLALRDRHRIRLWELIAIVGLAGATVQVVRNAVWLLLVAAYPASRTLLRPGPRPRLLADAAAAIAVGVIAALARTPRDPGSRVLAGLAARSGRVVLAEPVLAQQVAVAGGRVWMTNPIDAFHRADQRQYVAWFSGRPGGAGALRNAGLVLVRTGSDAGRLASKDRRVVLLSERDAAALYRVRRSRG
jgi:hypothetical protein